MLPTTRSASGQADACRSLHLATLPRKNVAEKNSPWLFYLAPIFFQMHAATPFQCLKGCQVGENFPRQGAAPIPRHLPPMLCSATMSCALAPLLTARPAISCASVAWKSKTIELVRPRESERRRLPNPCTQGQNGNLDIAIMVEVSKAELSLTVGKQGVRIYKCHGIGTVTNGTAVRLDVPERNDCSPRVGVKFGGLRTGLIKYLVSHSYTKGVRIELTHLILVTHIWGFHDCHRFFNIVRTHFHGHILVCIFSHQCAPA